MEQVRRGRGRYLGAFDPSPRDEATRHVDNVGSDATEPLLARLGRVRMSKELPRNENPRHLLHTPAFHTKPRQATAYPSGDWPAIGQRERFSRARILSLTFVLIGVATASCAGESTNTLTGEVDVRSPNLSLSGDSECRIPDLGFQGGAPVTVTNESDETIGLGRLKILDDDQTRLEREIGLGRGNCVFQFQVEDVADADFYAVEIGNKDWTFSAAELDKLEWNMEVELKDRY